MRIQLLGLLSACLLSAPVLAADDVVRANAPERYTVVKGDTLWGIADRFLKDPWRWPDVWVGNPQIKNPHLIYPGNTILLCHVQGEKVVGLDEGGGCPEIALRREQMRNGGYESVGADGVVKLRPAPRELPLEAAIPTIPLSKVQSFLNDSRIVTKQELDAAGYILEGKGGHVVSGQGDELYVRGTGYELGQILGVYRPGKQFVDPDTSTVIGYEAQDVAALKVIAIDGEIATMEVIRSREDVRSEDRVLPSEERNVASVFYPATPKGVKPGSLIHVFGSISFAALDSVVVLNRGEADGVKTGHIFGVLQKSGVIRDRIKNELVRLPDERVGLVMVFRTFRNASYALVLRSSRPLKVGDGVREPAGTGS